MAAYMVAIPESNVEALSGFIGQLLDENKALGEHQLQALEHFQLQLVDILTTE